ncbi:energy transducer TonB [Hymenobacter canadensis]|uniref:energy transducer TonB n=1 Tax=Hymenobacter canadensis TaxID=2999067 RepID=UPI0033144249
MVQFVVDTVGIVRNPSIMQSVDLLLDAEAVRVVLSLPRFTPGRLDGRVVPVSYTVPITFVLKEPLLMRRRRVDE